VETPLTTWYLPAADPGGGHVFDGRRGRALTAEEGEYAATLVDAAGQCAAITGDGEFMLEVPGPDAVTRRYRGQTNSTTSGQVYVLREQPPQLPAFDNDGLPIPANVQKWMLHGALRTGGLVLFLGPGGAGKTTTASAMIVERLRAFGGVAVTAEKPAEYAIGGSHGDGYCLQTEVEAGEGYGAAVRRALRCYPANSGSGLLFIGEIRDPDEAAEALVSGANGNLVLATMHADGLVSGLKRLVLLAAKRLGVEAAYDQLGTTLRLAFYQVLENRVLRVRVLQTLESAQQGKGLRERIKAGQLDSIAGDLESVNRRTRPDISTGRGR